MIPILIPRPGIAACLAAVLLATLAAPARSAPFVIDTAHTSAHFAASHFGRTLVRGRIMQVSGTIDFDAAGRTGQVDISLAADSLDTGVRVLDAVLKSPQFFDTEQYPTIRFVSSEFVFDGERLQAIRGILTLHGDTQPVQLQASRFSCGEIKVMVVRRQVCGGDFQATILRSAFGMTRMVPDVSDSVTIDIAIEATPGS